MNFETWKQALIEEIETAAKWRAEQILGDPDDLRIAKSQQMVFDLADKIKAMPERNVALQALFKEEQELANIVRAVPGEPESRYRNAKEELLRAIGFDHEPFESPEDFLDVLRAKTDEVVSEYRLRMTIGA
jgi:hypothetical protein